MFPLTLFVPYQRLTIVTPMSPVEAVERLAEVVGPPRGVLGGFWSADHKPYTGTVSGTHFKIVRHLLYRNSFRPVISGRVDAGPEGTVVHASLRPDLFVLVLMLVWLGVVVDLAAVEALAYLRAWRAAGALPDLGPYDLALPAAMLCLGYGVMLVAFRVEAWFTARFLRQLFAASAWAPSAPRGAGGLRLVVMLLLLTLASALAWALWWNAP